jgi:uncharacterized protein YdhG (YjbR/CyaY superfamily)
MATTTKAKKAPAKKAPAKKAKVFSDAEMEAMQDAKKERKKGSKADGLADLKAAIAKLAKTEQPVVEKLHEIVMANAPSLAPKTWYGMPAWAGADGKAVVYFTPASKFKERYATLGFNASAKLDEGNMWSTSWALLKLGAAEEKQIAALVRKAVG